MGIDLSFDSLRLDRHAFGHRRRLVRMDAATVFEVDGSSLFCAITV